MSAVQQKTERNQAVEWARLLAAVLVVFIHVPFPGDAGQTVVCLARIAVPFFFAVSGYYSAGADSGSLKRRLCRLLKLNLGATVLYFAWGCFSAVWYGVTVRDYLLGIFPDWKPLWNLLVLHVNPFAGHLWYLTALMCCDGVLWLYTRFAKRRGYGLLYILGAVLLAVFFVLSTVLPSKVHYYYYRNGWLMGLPVFLMGMFLREYGGRCPLKGRQLLLAALAGVGLSVVQMKLFGMTEIPVGMLAAAAAMILWLMEHPRLHSRRMEALTGSLGPVSTAMYVLHLALMQAYTLFWYPELSARFGLWEEWFRPFVVLGLSLAAAVVWERLARLGKKK